MKHALLISLAALALLCAATPAQAICPPYPESGWEACNPIRGGVGLWTPEASAECSGGFVTEAAGVRYLLTAGHCLRYLPNWREGPQYWGCTLTRANWRVDTGADVGILAIGGCGSEDYVESWATPWTLWEELPKPTCSLGVATPPSTAPAAHHVPHHRIHLAVAEMAQPPTTRLCTRYYGEHTAATEDWIAPAINPGKPAYGQEVCFYGHREDHSCGQVFGTGLTTRIEYAPGEIIAVAHTFEVCVAHSPGDSGGAIDARVGGLTHLPEARAEGILIAGGAQCAIGYEIKPALEAMGVTLP